MRVALVHDWLTGTRGGERVLAALLELFPRAEVFTLLHLPGTVAPEIEARPVHTSFIQRLPGAARRYRYYLPLFPAAVERFDLKGFDLVISSSHCVAKGVRPPPGVPHLCYCHTPMRYVWDAYGDYFGPGRAPGWIRAAAPLVARRLRRWDRATASRVDAFVANSEHVRDRIRRCYGRDAAVVHPPVELERFRPTAEEREDFYLIVSALVPYKRVDLAVEAFSGLDRTLVVVGSGPELPRLRRAGAVGPAGSAGSSGSSLSTGPAGCSIPPPPASPRILLTGRLPDRAVADLMGRCRAFVMPQEEDFGITAVEAQAAGAPVIAYGKGGAMETVVGTGGAGGATGVFFQRRTPEALREAVRRFESLRFDADRLWENAERFTREAFLEGVRAEVEALLEARGRPGGRRTSRPATGVRRTRPGDSRAERAAPPLHAVQVSGFLDPLGRDPEELLEAWPTLLDTASAAVEAGVRVTVLQAAVRNAELERRGVRFRFVAPPPVRRLLPWKLARRAASLRPRVVHLHGLGFPLHARLLAPGNGGAPPLLVQDHADGVPPPWRRPLHRWGLGGAAAVGFTARAQAEPFSRAGVLPPGVRVVELLESSSRFTPGDRDRARAATGLSGDPCVLWVGRLDGNKDPLTALEAAALAAEGLPDLRLWCCFTEAPLLDGVRARIATDPRLSGRVRLLGRVPHRRVEELCRAADLFLSASRFEGSGYAVLEALACGLPPVVTDIPSFRRMTDGGRVGRLAPPGDSRGLARALISAGEEARQGGEGVRREVRAHFQRSLSFEALGRELRQAYEMLSLAGAAERGRG